MHISGSCHCKNISFTLDWRGDPQAIPARACGCSFCVKHGAAWTADAASRLEVTVQQPELVTHYAFETRTAQFHICRRCGVVPLVTSDIDGRTYAVVNVATFDGGARALLKPQAVSFDAESEEQRLARRQRNWIADVAWL